MINSEDEIHRIVQQVVSRTLGEQRNSSAASSSTLLTGQPVTSAPAPVTPAIVKKTVAIGSDHGGLELKEILKASLNEMGYEVVDCGTHTKDAVDYPDYAAAVASLVAEGKAWRGVMIDGAGIGSCMAANKINGVRAAMCYDYATAVNSREHNDANVLTLGAGLIGVNQAKLILKTWLTTDFVGGRHTGRVNKIMALESGDSKDGK
jgi:ribose 5-phosphate isomerase B